MTRNLSTAIIILGAIIAAFPNTPADRQAGLVAVICGLATFIGAVVDGRRQHKETKQ